MATVASVYNIDRYKRKPDDLMLSLKGKEKFASLEPLLIGKS